MSLCITYFSIQIVIAIGPLTNHLSISVPPVNNYSWIIGAFPNHWLIHESLNHLRIICPFSNLWSIHKSLTHSQIIGLFTNHWSIPKSFGHSQSFGHCTIYESLTHTRIGKWFVIGPLIREWASGTEMGQWFVNGQWFIAHSRIIGPFKNHWHNHELSERSKKCWIKLMLLAITIWQGRHAVLWSM